MTFTLFTSTITNISIADFIERIKNDSKDQIIERYRSVYDSLESPDRWIHINHIPRVCVCSVYKKQHNQPVWQSFTGIIALTITGLNNPMEVEKAKRQVALMPQTLCAFMGADQHTMHLLCQATLPGGQLPAAKELAELFCAQAYATAVLSYTPNIEFPIQLEEPTLESTFRMPLDAHPYVNPHPTPFVIEQPTRQSINQLVTKAESENRLDPLRPTAGDYVSFTNRFSATYRRVREQLIDTPITDPMMIIPSLADECARVGLPEEDVVWRIKSYFHSVDIDDIRGTVSNIYSNLKSKNKFGIKDSMQKHQKVTYRLREFLNRRYDIRFNEVLQMTEFRIRRSLIFTYRELSARELNTIYHEALKEGIEATFGEVDKLVHSTFIPIYNPIEEYISNIPEWDGHDHIKDLAAMVPTNNPYWHRLFSRWFLSMVAHWMNSDTTHANATAPILIGAQGYRKSTFCRLLLPPELQNYFTDSIDFRTSIEAQRMLGRFLLINIDEFDQLSEKQFAFVKHLFQKPVSNIRRMHSESIGTQRRYASFIGTSNHTEVLRDPTGNRRYICVDITAPIATETSINYAQLYAQAKHLILRGERYWLNDEDEALIKESNHRYEIEDTLEQLFFTLFAIPTSDDDGTWMRPTEILTQLQSLPTFNRQTDNNTRKLGRILMKLGLKNRRSMKGTEYFVKGLHKISEK